MTEDKIDTITDSVDKNLSKLWEIVKDNESLPCCSPRGCKESDMTQQLKKNNNSQVILHIPRKKRRYIYPIFLFCVFLSNIFKLEIFNNLPWVFHISSCLPRYSLPYTLFKVICVVNNLAWQRYYLLLEEKKKKKQASQ